MKFAHLADLHIGRRFGEYSMKEDQQYALNAILLKLSELSPDAVFISGDVYDKSAPSEDAVSLADDFFTKLIDISPRVLIISGNHDSQTRLAFASRILSKRGLYVSREYNGTLERVEMQDADIWLMPHIRPREVARFFDGDISSSQEAVERVLEPVKHREGAILLAHQFVSSSGIETCDSEIDPVGGLNAVDLSAFDGFSYVALGHLHKPQKVGRDNVRYAGSPLKYSFSEVNHHKSFVWGGIDGSCVKTELIPIPSLRDARVITGCLDELLSVNGQVDDYVDAILTDEIQPVSPSSRLGRVYNRLVSVRYRPTGLTESVNDTIARGETPDEILRQFFKKMNGRDMTGAEEEYVERLWRNITEGRRI